MSATTDAAGQGYDAAVYARRYLTTAMPASRGEPGRLNGDNRYLPLGERHELGVSALAMLLLEWCETERSYGSLLDLAIQYFPEEGAVIETELRDCLAALEARDLVRVSAP